MSWDQRALFWINGHHHPVLDALLLPVSFVGEFGACWVLLVLLLLVFGKRQDREFAVLLGLTLLLVDKVICGAIGQAWFRERPYLVEEGLRQWGHRWTSSSFPSGHATSSMLGAVMVGAQYRRWLVPLLAFAVLTAYSRPYLAMHYPRDVLVSAALGAACAGAVLGLRAAWVRRRRSGTPGATTGPSDEPGG